MTKQKLKKPNYIDENELYTLLIQWKADKQENKTMSNRLCSIFMLMCDRILRKNTYQNVDIEVKNDIKATAMINLILYIHNFNIEKSKSSHAAFTYVTFSIETSYKSSLKKIKDKNERIPIIFSTQFLEECDFFDDYADF